MVTSHGVGNMIVLNKSLSAGNIAAKDVVPKSLEFIAYAVLEQIGVLGHGIMQP